MSRDPKEKEKRREMSRERRERRREEEIERGESTERVWRTTTLRVQATLRFQDSRILYLQNGRPTGRRWEVEHSWEYWKRHFEVSKKSRFIPSFFVSPFSLLSLCLFLYSTPIFFFHSLSLPLSFLPLFPFSFLLFSFSFPSFLSLSPLRSPPLYRSSYSTLKI